MLSIKEDIRAVNIAKAERLSSGHPVYRLIGHPEVGRPQIAIKAEVSQARELHFSSSLMNVIDPKAKQIILKPSELTELEQWGSPQGYGDITACPCLAGLLRDLRAPDHTWVKMKVRKLIPLEQAMDLRLGVKLQEEGSRAHKADFAKITRSDASVAKIAEVLSSNNGLHKLGRIIAVDFFIGSNDRFVYPPPGIKEVFLKERFKTIQNIGNVFVSIGHKSGDVPIGLDNFDPHQETKDPETRVVKGGGGNRPNWSGEAFFLASDIEKKQFAENVIFDLNLALGMIGSGRKAQSRLPSNAAERLLGGIEDGISEIGRKASGLFPDGELPAGVRDRLHALNGRSDAFGL